MLRGAGLGLLAVCLLAAGCIGSQTPGEEDAAPATAGDSLAELPTEAPQEGERGLQDPPTLREGEWWAVQLTSATFGIDTEATIVNAGVEGERYLVGMPADDYVLTALILHLPGIGPVERSTFGYESHDILFEPVTFPLDTGRTWTTEWYTGELDAEVVEADGNASTATVELVGDNEQMRLIYEAGLGLPRSLEIAGYGSYEVTDHGYGYEGQIKVPWEHDIVFLNGRVGPALDTNLEPAPPVESITVEDGYDEAAIALLTGNLVLEGPPGVYRVSAQAPSGDTYQDTFVPQPGGQQIRMVPHAVPDPGGTWEMEYEAGGAGVAAVEGMAYEVVERTLGEAG